MQKDTVAAASAHLLAHVEAFSCCESLPVGLRPQTRAEAYEIQALWEACSAQPLAGWKIAATSVAGQKHIGVDGPLAGRYIAERVVGDGGHIPFGHNHMKVAEVEFAFKLGRDLPPRARPYDDSEVFAAVASLHPAIEIPDSRYDHFEKVGGLQLIADNACAHWMALGTAAPDLWLNMDLAEFGPTGQVNGGAIVQGRGANVLGSPRIAMVWIANELSRLGLALRTGQFVTTGTCVVPMPIAAGDVVRGDFGPLGHITVTLGP
jgi:2-keto-4-pentenoate hydratase